MVCCRQAISHYLHQCWTRSTCCMPPYSVTIIRALSIWNICKAFSMQETCSSRGRSHWRPSTKPNQTKYKLAAHHRAQPCGSVVCWLVSLCHPYGYPTSQSDQSDNNVSWPNVETIVPTLRLRRANLHCVRGKLPTTEGITVVVTKRVY